MTDSTNTDLPLKRHEIEEYFTRKFDQEIFAIPNTRSRRVPLDYWKKKYTESPFSASWATGLSCYDTSNGVQFGTQCHRPEQHQEVLNTLHKIAKDFGVKAQQFIGRWRNTRHAMDHPCEYCLEFIVHPGAILQVGVYMALGDRDEKIGLLMNFL
jgi:hypothetical protein